MNMFFYSGIIAALFSLTAYAGDGGQCYVLTQAGQNAQSGRMCIEAQATKAGYLYQSILFEVGDSVFQSADYAKLAGANCLECNKDFYAIIVGNEVPATHSLDAFMLFKMNPIQFDGSIDLITLEESGTVTIGEAKYNYSTPQVRAPASVKKIVGRYKVKRK